MSISKLLYQNLIWRGGFYFTGFILNIMIARLLGAALSGELYYLISILAFLTLMASISLESGLTYFAAGNKIETHRLFTTAIAWTLAAVSVVTCVSLLIANTLSIRLQSGYICYGIIFLLGNLLMTFMGSLFYSGNEYKSVNLVGIATNIFLIISIALLSRYSSRIVQHFFFIYFTSYLVQGIIVTLLFAGTFGPLRFQLVNKMEGGQLLKYCLVAFLSNIITFLIYRVDYWFVERFCSSTELGNYIQVSRIAQLFFIIPTILAAVIFPVTAGGKRSEANALVQILSRSIFFFYGILCLIVLLVGKPVFPLVFGETFNQMYVPFALLVPGILSLSMLYTLTAYFAGKGKVSVNLKGSFYTVILICAGDALFIPKFGISAAAAVSSFGYTAYFLYVFRTFLRDYGVDPGGFFVFRFSDLRLLRKAFITQRTQP